MPIPWFLWAAFTFYQQCAFATQDDLDTAAITVYRNPEFFRHLSDEFNNHLNHYGNKEYPLGPRDEYHSPYEESTSTSYPESEDGFRHTSGEYSEENASDDWDEAHLQEESNGDESDTHGFSNHKNYSDDEASVPAEQQDVTEDDGDVYKYPGEPKSPNAPGKPVFTHFDGSPDFNHPPRNIPVSKKPRKKGRGPYGHPRVVNSNRSYGTDGENYPKYSDDFEHDRRKNEELQLPELERENENKKLDDDEDDHHQQQLKIYHNGHRYPLNIQPYREPVEPLHDGFPLGHYEDYHRYPPTDDYHPAAQNVHYPSKGVELRPVHPFPVEQPFVDTKKGTREYLKFHTYPSNHELQDLNKPVIHKKPKQEIVSCNTLVRHKKPRTFAAYRIRPMYSHYRVVPVYYRKSIPIFKRSAKPKLRARSKISPKVRLVENDSAYILNSELDQDYQNIKIVKKKSNN